MQWLRARCTPIAPEQFAAAQDFGNSSLPQVLVTFDDGYRDFFDNAYPILKEFDIPALVFLATRFLDEGGMIWTDVVATAVMRSRRSDVAIPWNGRTCSLKNDADRVRCRLLCTGFLKSIPDAEREHWQRELMTALAVTSHDIDTDRQMLTWDEVRAAMPLIRFGGHTHNHPILSQLDASAIDAEIRTCRDRISAELGVAPRYFAYPNGRAQDFTEEAVSCLKRHGFELGFSTIEGIHRPGADLYRILRQPTGCTTIGDFAALVMGKG
jgi:peptidoglycan/xylan/chitin deacetylase (PgdA/CDA1 family)